VTDKLRSYPVAHQEVIPEAISGSGGLNLSVPDSSVVVNRFIWTLYPIHPREAKDKTGARNKMRYQNRVIRPPLRQQG